MTELAMWLSEMIDGAPSSPDLYTIASASSLDASRNIYAQIVLDSFINSCRQAVIQADAVATIRASVEHLVSEPAALATAYPAPPDCTVISGHTDYIFEDDTLTVAMVHTPPGTLQPPHDHTMTAIIGGYAGIELHRLYRRTPAGDQPLVAAGTTDVGPSDVLTFGIAGVHAIDAAPGAWSSAIHVYLGGLSAVSRSVFHPDTFEERPLTMEIYDAWCRPASG